MKLKFFIIGLAGCLVPTIHAQYVPDVLGENYLQRTICMPADYEGEVVCTIVKKTPLPNCNRAVLYVHGYNDYFFQKELGDSINSREYNFYALDLRKYGRSILPGQNPFFCKSLKEYFADLDTVLTIIRSEGNSHILLMAHSTGGLITSYYLNHRKENMPVEGLILNSPFLDWNFSPVKEKFLIPVIAFIGRFFPNWMIQGAGGISSYAKSLLKRFYGEWEFDTRWKKPEGHPIKAGWIHAVQEAQQSVRKKSNIDCPVLVLSSQQSLKETENWQEDFKKSDIVLDVQDIQRLGKKLGKQVVCNSIRGGMHDLILSEKSARDETYKLMLDWMERTALSDK